MVPQTIYALRDFFCIPEEQYRAPDSLVMDSHLQKWNGIVGIYSKQTQQAPLIRVVLLPAVLGDHTTYFQPSRTGMGAKRSLRETMTISVFETRAVEGLG